MGEPAGPGPDAFRWQALFQHSAEPLFLLNRRRRLLFVNHAWERLTAIPVADARTMVCRRRRAPADEAEALASALSPPAHVLQGATATVRRLRMVAGARHWWDVEFWPLAGDDGVRAILGKIRVVEAPSAVSVVPLPEKLIALRRQVAQRYRLEQLASDAPAMQQVIARVTLATQSQATVLISGEPGVGKEWLARLIHHHGRQRELIFAGLDCAGLPGAAVAGALFGPGSLTRRAGVGTIYLREPAALPREVQGQLHEWLAAPEPRPRVIAGLRSDVAALVRTGDLLEELAAQLGTLPITLPPLRERRADLPALAAQLLDMETRRRGMAADAWEVLQAHAWPDNLRELAAVLQAARTAAGAARIEATHLPAYLRGAVARADLPPRLVSRPLPLNQLLEQVERRLIELALKAADGNRSQAAEQLAVSRPALLRRIEALGIHVP